MRNEGKAKAGYFRTPEAVIKALARYVKIQGGYGSIALLDPCCGKGIALDLLAKEITRRHVRSWDGQAVPTLTTYGVEPNRARAGRASRRLDHTMTASFFEGIISNHAVALALVNPPYEWDDEALKPSGARERLEVSFLRKVTVKLCSGGILLYILPQQVLKEAALILASWYKDFTFFRFPDTAWDPREEEDKKAEGGSGNGEQVSMYGQFGQCVLIARRQSFQMPPLPADIELLTQWSEMGEDAPALPLEEDTQPEVVYKLPSYASEMKHFVAKAFDPEKAAQLASVLQGESAPSLGVWAQPLYQKSHWPRLEDQKVSVGRPMAPLKKQHLAILAVAGFINGSTLVGKDGSRLTVRGYSRKVPSHRVVEDEEAITETVTDRYVSALFGIDPDSGQLYCIDTGKPISIPFNLSFERMSMTAFLDNYGVALTEEIARTNPALYVGEAQVPWASSVLKQLLRRPLGRQRDFLLAQVNYLLHTATRSGEIAEMATGKTFLSLAIAYVGDLWASGHVEDFPVRYVGRKSNRRRVKPPHFFPGVVLTPEIMTYKWKREAEITIPGIKAVVVQRIDTQAKAQELRAFDPSYDGVTHLSAVGCMDRVIARIRDELTVWEARCRLARQRGEPLPKKPAHLVIINSSTAKMGMEWIPCYHLRPVRTQTPSGKVALLRDPETEQVLVVPSCPHCGKPIRNMERVQKKVAQDARYRRVLQLRDLLAETAGGNTGHQEAYTEEMEEPASIFATEQEIWGSGESRKKWSCSACGEALWQSATASQTSWQSTSPLSYRVGETTSTPLPLPLYPGNLPPVLTSTANRRYPIADYLRKQYPGFFHLLITDEIHQGADGTALGLAREALMRASRRVVGLTGTLCNGKASSLLPLLRMINPSVMSEYGYNGTAAWVRAFGVIQRQVRHYKEREEYNSATGAVTKRRASTGKVVEKEIAGFSPQGLRYVLDCCNFLELSDVAPNLPKRQEYIHVVPLGDTLGDAYEVFEEKITRALGQMLVKGDKSGLSAWFNALLIYPNLPWEGFVCQVKKSGELLGTAPRLPEQMIYPKERELVTYVEEQVKRGRRVLVYSEHTGSYDILPRLQKILVGQVKHDRPLRVKILRSDTVKPIHREEWLRKTVEEGVDVLICNPALVQVGLDLIDFPSIVFFELPTSTSKLRQASRRNHRPGQKLPCEVVYLSYPTMELRMLGLMAAKTRTSMMVEGQIGEEGLVAFQGEDEDSEGGDTLALQMANAILKAMDQGTQQEEMAAFASSLQNRFTENAELEQELQTTITVDAHGTLVESSATKYLSTEEEEVPQEKVVPLIVEEVSQHILVVPDHSLESGILEEVPAEPVVVVPISPLTDPWEILRAQVKGQGRPKKGKKGEEARMTTLAATSLWSA